ncbi:DUF58 domain-containing protein [Thermosulfidibacter takaii]|uniref:DUF58 domain-containing protein n=1 Tax=Thermosulfidibacter takaii TaxID=412593 RepID=UPI000837D154|nr:DUF58 domain-containing protein [Thermosulfidibacter takaii]
MTVYPQPIPGEVLTENINSKSGKEKLKNSWEADSEVRDFEDFREGVPLNRIAWKPSARRRKLLIKVNEADTSGAVLIDLSNLMKQP